MICPNCQTSNRAESKFCKSCGASLSQISSPEMSPVQPGKQSFQAQQSLLKCTNQNHVFRGYSITYRTVAPASASDLAADWFIRKDCHATWL